MSLARKQAWISAGAWFVVTVAFFTLFFHEGPEGFAAEENRRVRTLAAWIILPGYLVNFAIMFRARRGRQRGELDERDKAVERQASMVVLPVVLMAVFLACIALFDHYRAAGTVPVGWLWLMGYGTVALVSLLHPAVALVVDLAGRADA